MSIRLYHWPHLFGIACSVFCLILLAACANSSSIARSSSPQQTATPQPISRAASLPTVPATCQPTSFTPFNNFNGLQEGRGQATNAELWALVFANPQSIHAGQKIKIVWRMTGSGDFHVVARHKGDVQVNPTQGPVPHTGSNWNRPGGEWGTEFKFPLSGCWDLHATFGTASGEIWIMVH
jgi:hypothetical protein